MIYFLWFFAGASIGSCIGVITMCCLQIMRERKVVKMSKFTCNGCENRYVGCHRDCKKYKRERKEYEKAKEYVNEDKEYVDYMIRSMGKNKRNRK